MLEVQRFEEELIGLLGVREEIESAGRGDIEAFGDVAVWEELFTLPAGRLAQRLGLSGHVGGQVRRGIDARNRLAHHYLRDWDSRLNTPEYRAQAIDDLRHAVERFRSLATAVATERFEVMHRAGLTDDELSTPDEQRRLRYYDPTVDDDRPPRPFAD